MHLGNNNDLWKEMFESMSVLKQGILGWSIFVVRLTCYIGWVKWINLWQERMSLLHFWSETCRLAIRSNLEFRRYYSTSISQSRHTEIIHFFGQKDRSMHFDFEVMWWSKTHFLQNAGVRSCLQGAAPDRQLQKPDFKGNWFLHSYDLKVKIHVSNLSASPVK